MVDDIAGDGDDAASHGVVGGGEERNLRFWVLRVLWFRMRELNGVRSLKLKKSLKQCQNRS
jgi:hypothetical protein